jgi:hypothetical protein
MSEVSSDQLRDAVEGLHGCKAELRQIVEVREQFQGAIVWHGGVHVFDLAGHPETTVCYAWSSPIEGSEKRKFYAVLKLPPVSTPEEAVRVAILSDLDPEKRFSGGSE